MKYLIVIEKGHDGYGAQAPDVPGCISWGPSLGHLLQNMQEALTAHLEGEPVPESHNLDWHMQHGDPDLRPDADSIIAWVEVPTEEHHA